jgi:hypothetical protein
VWRRSGSLSALLDYALFRRDLGHLLPRPWAAAFAADFNRLNARRQQLALLLIKEAGLSVELPAPAAAPSGPKEGKSGEIRSLQGLWRGEFSELVRQNAAMSGICVVGNAGRMSGSRLGAAIDSHSLVVRFNRFRGNSSDEADIGARLDVWVVAPAFSGKPPPMVKWVVLSGPNMQYRLHNWKRLLPAREAGAAILTIPLPPWRRLVARLQAPPSAGVLFLAWLNSILSSWGGVSAFGFGLSPFPNKPYHHAVRRHQPARRHNWAGERLLLRQWKDEGLALDAGI